MTKRLHYASVSPKGFEILLEQEKYLRQQFDGKTSISTTTWELIKLRISQINQCAFCIDMHSKDAFKLGESPERIIGLSAWKDMPHYSEIERQALTWAELLTANARVTDEDYRQALEAFGENGLVDLTIAVNAINSWNRIVKVFKTEVGSYKPA